MYVFLQKVFIAVLSIQICTYDFVTGIQSYVASFQTDITGSHLARSNVWIEYDRDIPMAKEFTVCHWIKINFYNIDLAACLWSYCTIGEEGQQMECLQVCMKGHTHTAFRDLEIQGEIKLRNFDDVMFLPQKLNNYQHRTWTHLCWSFSSNTGESKYYHNGEIVSIDILDVAINDLPLKPSQEMHDAALIFGQEPDVMRGGFNKGQAYLGELSELNIWNYTLNDSDIGEMAACNRLKRGNILAWEKSSWILNNVPIEDIQDPAHFCAGLRQYVIFPEKTKFLEAQKIWAFLGVRIQKK